MNVEVAALVTEAWGPRPLPRTHAALSLNLYDPTLTREVDDSLFGSPLIIAGAFVVFEVVFWSPRWQRWIMLVRERTTRSLPAHCLEVAVDELTAYERSMLGIGG